MGRKPMKPEERRHKVTVSLERELYVEVARVLKKVGMSFSGFVEEAMRQARPGLQLTEQLLDEMMTKAAETGSLSQLEAALFQQKLMAGAVKVLGNQLAMFGQEAGDNDQDEQDE